MRIGGTGIAQINFCGVTPIFVFQNNNSTTAPTAQFRFTGGSATTLPGSGTVYWGFGSHEYAASGTFEIFGGSGTVSNAVEVFAANGSCGIGIGNLTPAVTLSVYNAKASTGSTQLLGVKAVQSAADATTNALLRVNQGGGTTAVFEVLGSGDIVSGGNAGVTQTAEAVGTLATTNGIVTTFTAVSDERLKNSVAYEGGLNEILAITPIRYRWNEEGQRLSGQKGDRDYVGFSAQNTQKSIPETIQSVTNEGYLSFEDRPIIAALVNAVKQQQQQIEELKETVRKLAGQ